MVLAEAVAAAHNGLCQQQLEFLRMDLNIRPRPQKPRIVPRRHRGEVWWRIEHPGAQWASSLLWPTAAAAMQQFDPE